MRPLKVREVIRVLESNGFYLARQKGSHCIYRNSLGIIVPVPLHGSNKPIPIGTFLAIIKQSKLSKELFI
ncbi:MAG: type II toxin-antitoxin system HicA family toxin [Patescibacteria group bacterium]|jgi:predicted RNA binding protein YcfA (HicA-like mRNA interferase family)